jgi:hypothetical protein
MTPFGGPVGGTELGPLGLGREGEGLVVRHCRRLHGVRERELKYWFSSLLKQKIKTKNKKNLLRHLQRRNFFFKIFML